MSSVFTPIRDAMNCARKVLEEHESKESAENRAVEFSHGVEIDNLLSSLLKLDSDILSGDFVEQKTSLCGDRDTLRGQLLSLQDSHTSLLVERGLLSSKVCI